MGNPLFQLDCFDFNKKVLFHPEQIAAYRAGSRPFPLTLEVDLTNRCNHDCSFCFYAEHIHADKSALLTHLLLERLAEARQMGTKAISFTGGGEPMLHKDYVPILIETKKMGFDVGTITNGSVITERNVDVLLENLQWIRISMAGGDRESYRQVQGVDQFDKVVGNLHLLAKEKKRYSSSTAVGLRALVTVKNVFSMPSLGKIAKELNLNYLQLAPDQLSQDGSSFWNSENTQKVFSEIEKELRESKTRLLTTTFLDSQKDLNRPRTCYAHFFMTTITAEGDLIFCKNARGSKRFSIGNIKEKNLKQIWEDLPTKEIEEWVRPNNCGLFCKHMAINNTMETILHPDSNLSPNFVG